MAVMGTLCESFHECVSFHDRKLAQRQLMSFLFFRLSSQTERDLII